MKVCFLEIELANLLVDIGSKSFIKEPVKKRIRNIRKRKNNYKYYEFDLGNAKSALFNIKRKNNGNKFKPKDIPILNEAKNHYWRAYKKLDNNDEKFKIKLLTNLGQTLSTCGRVAEALQYYDRVLEISPEFSNANMSRAEDLRWLSELSITCDNKLRYEALKGYSIGANSRELTPSDRQYCKTCASRTIKILEISGYSFKEIYKCAIAADSQYFFLNNYQQFCLDNNLMLSEHSLYCKCNNSCNDNIEIYNFKCSKEPDFLEKMKVILKRLKSEFSFAKKLYYQSISNLETTQENEEKLRTSFRLCYAILDKIGFAICELFNLATPNENILFENFWNPKNNKDKRWELINNIEVNYPLNGLYSIANDLNQQDGEWKFLKEWRNKLEHKILIIGKKSDNSFDYVNIDEFNKNTLHLLQLVRSAIITFVLCVRTELLKEKK